MSSRFEREAVVDDQEGNIRCGDRRVLVTPDEFKSLSEFARLGPGCDWAMNGITEEQRDYLRRMDAKLLRMQMEALRKRGKRRR